MLRLGLGVPGLGSKVPYRRGFHTCRQAEGVRRFWGPESGEFAEVLVVC